MPPKPTPETLGQKIAKDLLNRPRPSAESSDDEPYQFPAHVQEQVDKLHANQTALKLQAQGLVDFVQYFIDHCNIEDAEMVKTIVVDEPSTESTESAGSSKAKQKAKDEQPNKGFLICAVHNGHREHAQADWTLEQFCKAIGLEELFKKGIGSPFSWPKKAPNYGESRIDWLQLQPELHAFWNADSNQILVMECSDLTDADASPITQVALWHARDMQLRGGFNFMLNGPTQRHLTFTDCLTFLIGKVVVDGSDPNVKYPEAKGPTPALLSALLMSHLRVSEVSIMLAGVGVYEHDDKCVAEWYQACKQLVALAKVSLPGLKPFRLLFLNPEKSEAVNKIKAENPDIPVIQCPTGAEFIQQYPTGSVKSGKKDKKDKKGTGKRT